jgi:hypothetical protein
MAVPFFVVHLLLLIPSSIRNAFRSLMDFTSRYFSNMAWTCSASLSLGISEDNPLGRH